MVPPLTKTFTPHPTFIRFHALFTNTTNTALTFCRHLVQKKKKNLVFRQISLYNQLRSSSLLKWSLKINLLLVFSLWHYLKVTILLTVVLGSKVVMHTVNNYLGLLVTYQSLWARQLCLNISQGTTFAWKCIEWFLTFCDQSVFPYTVYLNIDVYTEYKYSPRT